MSLPATTATTSAAVDPAIASWNTKADAYNNLTYQYPTAYRACAQSLVELVKQHMNQYKTHYEHHKLTILDLGSGSGLSAELLLSSLTDQIDTLYLLEPAQVMNELAQQRLAKYNSTTRIVYLPYTAEQVMVHEEYSTVLSHKVDIVFSNVTFHYLSPPSTMKCVHDMLRPDVGLFVFNVWGNFLLDTASRQNPKPHIPVMEAACQQHECQFIDMFAKTSSPPNMSIQIIQDAAANASMKVNQIIEDSIEFPIAFYIDVSTMTAGWPATNVDDTITKQKRQEIIKTALELSQTYPSNSIFCVRFVATPAQIADSTSHTATSSL